MSVTRLPSGRWRSQVWHPGLGRNVSAGSVLNGPASYATKREAKAAREDARRAVAGYAETKADGPTVAAFRERWLTDPIFKRPKRSTMLHNAERTKAFAEHYGEVALGAINDEVVAQWLAGGVRSSTVPALRAMFNDAASAKAGRLIAANPFAGLGISKGRGRADKQPPSEAQVWDIIGQARRLAGPSFAAWLQVAAFTGMRPGEVDALRWSAIDWSGDRIRVAEQYSAGSRAFTSPKNGEARWAMLTPPARDALRSLTNEGEWCFPSLRGTHWTPSSRAYHWKAIRAAAGWEGDLYLATRHFAGWYMTEVLDLPAEDVAIALGHTDGGQLVRRTYGHRDHARALKRATAAYSRTGTVKPLRAVERRETA